mgnify:CR=1 FL=1
MDVEIAFSPEGLSARLFIINIRFYESELNPKSVIWPFKGRIL